MAKRKKQRTPKSTRRNKAQRIHLTQEYVKAEALLERNRWAEAYPILVAIDEQVPNDSTILSDLVNVCYELQDYHNYLFYIRKLFSLRQDDPEISFSLAAAYHANMYPMAALYYGHRFLQRFPRNEHAQNAHALVAELEEIVPELLAELEVDEKSSFEVAYRHDLLRAALEYGDREEAKRIGKKILRLYPDFIPALNNLSLIEFQSDNATVAIRYARQVLAKEPDNFQASANLTHFLYLTGKVDEAQAQGNHLYDLTSENLEIWVKKAEAFTYLGDDEAVFDVVEQAAQLEQIELLPSTGLLYHLGAVAALRLDDEASARTYWQKAVKHSPRLAIAQENLDDLNEPIGSRNAPWPFRTHQWLPADFFRAMDRIANQRPSRKQPSMSQQVANYFDKQPNLLHRLTLLLERGDARARNLVLEMAEFNHHPGYLAMLQSYAFSTHGTDESRVKALNIVTRAGLVANGLVEMWIQDEWTEVLNIGFEIGDESDVDHPIQTAQAQEWMTEATYLLYDNKVEEAQALLLQALELEPDTPGILNNLALTYEKQGDRAKAEEMVDRIHAAHPDYLFARTAIAGRYIDDGEPEQAEEILQPLLTRKQLHHSEFISLAEAYMHLYLAQNKATEALNWLNLMRQIDPDHPRLATWERAIGQQQAEPPAIKPKQIARLFRKMRRRAKSQG